MFMGVVHMCAWMSTHMSLYAGVDVHTRVCVYVYFTHVCVHECVCIHVYELGEYVCALRCAYVQVLHICLLSLCM